MIAPIVLPKILININTTPYKLNICADKKKHILAIECSAPRDMKDITLNTVKYGYCFLKASTAIYIKKPHMIDFISTLQIGAASFVATRAPAAALGSAIIRQHPIIFPIRIIKISKISFLVETYPIAPVYNLN